MKIIESKPIPLAAVVEKLEKKAKESALEYEQKNALEYAKKFSIGKKKTKEILKALKEKGIDEETAVALVNLSPKEPDSVKLIGAWRGIEIDEEKAKEIVELFK